MASKKFYLNQLASVAVGALAFENVGFNHSTKSEWSVFASDLPEELEVLAAAERQGLISEIPEGDFNIIVNRPRETSTMGNVIHTANRYGYQPKPPEMAQPDVPATEPARPTEDIAEITAPKSRKK